MTNSYVLPVKLLSVISKNFLYADRRNTTEDKERLMNNRHQVAQPAWGVGIGGGGYDQYCIITRVHCRGNRYGPSYVLPLGL